MTRGGLEVWLLRVLRRLDLERFPTTICAVDVRPGELDDEVRSLGVEIVPCRFTAGWLTFRKAFRALLRERHADVLHSHLFFLSGALARLARQEGARTRIAHAHTSRDYKPDSLSRRAYYALMRRSMRKYCTHVIGCSSEAGDFVFGPGWQRRTGANLMPCGIDVGLFEHGPDRAALCRSLGIPSSRRVVGHVGSFRYAKNHEFVIQVFHKMVAKRDDLQLVLVGDGELTLEVRALCAQLGVAERVTFAGQRDDVPELMNSLFDLFLFPSRWEGLGVVVIEAQCAALPALISDRVPAAVVLDDRLVVREPLENGAEEWARKGLEFLSHPRPDPVQTRRAVRDSMFSIETNLRLLESLYAS